MRDVIEGQDAGAAADDPTANVVDDAQFGVENLDRELGLLAAEIVALVKATVDELDRLKRWIYGQRRERIIEDEGQRHLFDLQGGLVRH